MPVVYTRELHHPSFYGKYYPCTLVQDWPFRLARSSKRIPKKRKKLTPFLSNHWLTIAIQLEMAVLRNLSPSMLAHGAVWPSACLLWVSILLCVHIILNPRLAILLLVFFSLYFCPKLSSFLLCWVICIFLASHSRSNIYCIFAVSLYTSVCINIHICLYYVLMHSYPSTYILTYSYVCMNMQPMLMCVY